MRTIALALTASLIACGNNSNTTTDAPKLADAAHDAGSGSGSGSGSADSFQITGFANGLYWDATTSALYFTEKVTGSGNAFCKWTDADGIQVIASLDAITGVDPGEIVKLSDGSFIFPQFSTATADPNNGIIQVVGSDATLYLEAAGSANTEVGNWRSVGLVLGSDGQTIYQSAFVKGTSFIGDILQTSLGSGSGSDTAAQNVFFDNSTTPMPTGKVVGLVANADGTFILGDQTNNTFLKISADGKTSTTFVASYTKPDLLLQLPDGNMLDGGGTGASGRAQAINHIALADGTVTPLTFTGFTFTYVAGMAYDAVGHRLFVDDQTGSANDTFDILPYMP
jgi:hypothetical protein